MMMSYHGQVIILRCYKNVLSEQAPADLVGSGRCDKHTFIFLQIQFLVNVTIAASRHEVHSEQERQDPFS